MIRAKIHPAIQQHLLLVLNNGYLSPGEICLHLLPAGFPHRPSLIFKSRGHCSRIRPFKTGVKIIPARQTPGFPLIQHRIVSSKRRHGDIPIPTIRDCRKHHFYSVKKLIPAGKRFRKLPASPVAMDLDTNLIGRHHIQLIPHDPIDIRPAYFTDSTVKRIAESIFLIYKWPDILL